MAAAHAASEAPARRQSPRAAAMPSGDGVDREVGEQDAARPTRRRRDRRARTRRGTPSRRRVSTKVFRRALASAGAASGTMSSGPDRERHRASAGAGGRRRRRRCSSAAEPHPSGARDRARQEVRLADEVGDEQRRRMAVDLESACRPARSTPWFITTMRSAIDSASSWSWVTMMVVTPSLRCSSLISWRRCTRTLASSADSGSSSSSRPGEIAMARASATRCCWPPESCAGYFLRLVGEPDQREQLGDARVDLGARPLACSRARRRCSSRSSGWGTARRTGRRCRSRASTAAGWRCRGPPARSRRGVCRSSPAMARSSVVLPQPDGPRKQTNSPSLDVERDVPQRDELAECLPEAVDLR